MESEDDVKVMRAGVADLERIQQLYRKVYGRTPNTDYYERKLNSSSHPAIVFAAVERSGDFVSMNCFYRYELKLGTDVLPAAIPGDLMTDPAHRKQGLAHECLRLGIEESQKSGVTFFFNFSNKHTSAAQMQKFGWDCSRDCFLLSQSVAGVPFAKLGRRFSWMQRVLQFYRHLAIRFLFKPCEPFQNSEVAHKGAGIVHDAAFFRYRTYTSNFFLQSGPYKFWLKADGDLKVGDIAYVENADAVEVIKILRRVAVVLGCNRIMCISTANSWLHQLLQAHMERSAVQKLCIHTTQAQVDVHALQFNWGDTDSF